MFLSAETNVAIYFMLVVVGVEEDYSILIAITNCSIGDRAGALAAELGGFGLVMQTYIREAHATIPPCSWLSLL
jgi:uncharacterized ion transporter superfamily protein YfcC